MQVTATPTLQAGEENPRWQHAVSRAVANDPQNSPFGPEQKRPEGDFRSAKQIIDDSPLLKNLGDQSDVKKRLEDRVGDFQNDPDAAYRATQVLEHIEQLDENGDAVIESFERNDPGNGKVDGFTKGGDARHGTEAGRLQDFGKYGWDTLKGQLESEKAKPETAKGDAPSNHLPLPGETRPDDDTRSAENIINDNPLLKNLGDQSDVKKMLEARVGDFTHDADAAWRAVQVLNYVENYDEKGAPIDGGDVGNGRIDGFTKDEEARHGTEAGRLQDFGKYGYDSLKGLDGLSAEEQIADLNAQATEKAVKDAGGDASKVGESYFIDGKTDASGADKTAAIIELANGLANFKAGEDAFAHKGPDAANQWSGDGPSPGEERQQFVDDVQSRIDTLSKDPDVQQFLNEKGSEALQQIVAADPALKAELERRLDVTSSSHALLDAFNAKDADGNPVSTTDALSSFISYPNFYAQALGTQPDFNAALEGAPQAVKDRVSDEYQRITSGEELQALIDGGKPADQAVIESAVNKAVYDAVLDDKTVQAGTDAFNSATGNIGRAELLSGQTLDNLYRSLGVTGADDPRLAKVIEDNIAAMTLPGETPPRTADIIAAIRNVETAVRGGLKLEDALNKVEDNLKAINERVGLAGGAGGTRSSGAASDAYSAGVLHVASAVLLAGALGTRLAGGTGNTPATVTSSFQVAGLLTEGGAKFAADQMARFNSADAGYKVPAYVKDVENIGKSLGGVVGNVLGLATGAISAKQAADGGDKVGAGFQGTFAGLNGVASIAGAVEVATYVVPRVITVAQGVAEFAGVISGAAGAIAGAVGGVAAVGGLIYAIIADIKAEEAERKQQEEWHGALTEQFADFGLTPPPLDVIIAPENGYIVQEYDPVAY